MTHSRLTALAKALTDLHERCPCPAENGECSAANECALLPLAPLLRDGYAAALVALDDAEKLGRHELTCVLCGHGATRECKDYVWLLDHAVPEKRAAALAQAETVADALLGKEETG